MRAAISLPMARRTSSRPMMVLFHPWPNTLMAVSYTHLTPDIPSGRNHQRIEHIQAEAIRMKQLLESLLTLAKSDSGEQPWEHSRISLSFIVNSSILSFEPVAFDMGKYLSLIHI